MVKALARASTQGVTPLPLGVSGPVTSRMQRIPNNGVMRVERSAPVEIDHVERRVYTFPFISPPVRVEYRLHYTHNCVC